MYAGIFLAWVYLACAHQREFYHPGSILDDPAINQRRQSIIHGRGCFFCNPFSVCKTETARGAAKVSELLTCHIIHAIMRGSTPHPQHDFVDIHSFADFEDIHSFAQHPTKFSTRQSKNTLTRKTTIIPPHSSTLTYYLRSSNGQKVRIRSETFGPKNAKPQRVPTSVWADFFCGNICVQPLVTVVGFVWPPPFLHFAAINLRHARQYTVRSRLITYE